jgi:hypothetical protein
MHKNPPGTLYWSFKEYLEMSSLVQINPSLDSLGQKKRLFIICDDCFWCASALDTRPADIDSCALCARPVSSLPIGQNEKYLFKYTPKRGVELEFSSIG